jgi:competence protein CoiA
VKYALVDNIKAEAKKGLKGICPICASELTAKCGEYKVNHWAHKKSRNCDLWWEPETEWHRNWKNNYPTEWQEFLFTDQSTNEKHIADVHTSHNLVIEFQHSGISSNERKSRESFYGNMIWVVDGTRLKRDFPRFMKSYKYFKNPKKGHFLVDHIEEVFPENWLNSSVPVLFDFKGLNDIIDNSDIRNNLYCLFKPEDFRVRERLLIEIPRKAFIRTTINGEWIIRSKKFIEPLNPIKARPIQNQVQAKKQVESSHYVDMKKGKIIKKRRL